MKLFWVYFATVLTYLSTLFYQPAVSFSPEPSYHRKLHQRHATVAKWVRQAKDAMKGEALKIIDTDNDGRVSWAEYESAALFHWTNRKNAETGHRLLGLPSILESFELLDTDADGFLDVDELGVAFDHMNPDNTEHDKLTSKIDTCTLSQTVRCNDYIMAAERISVSKEHSQNPVQRCIMASGCDDICRCISSLERALLGQQVVVIQDSSSNYLVDFNTTHHLAHEKRFPFLIIGAIFALTSTIIGLTLSDLGEILGQEDARLLDFKIWDIDAGDKKPLCAAYAYWSTNCAAIGTGHARSCSDGGSRLHENACKDHFRRGSKGCGFLGFGCRSLCYDVNHEGCPCWWFRYEIQADVDYPGNDFRTFHTKYTSECRQACEDIDQCVMFVTYADTGKDEKHNCFLKNQKGPFQRVKGATTHIKLGGDTTGGGCTKDITFGGKAELYDRELHTFNPTEEWSLSKRASEPPPGSWPFDPRDVTFLVIINFLRQLYATDGPWINQDDIAQTYRYAVTPDGPRQLTPDANEPIENTANPRWRLGEVWRVLNVFRALLSYASATNVPDNTTPVARFLADQATQGGGLAAALFPTGIQNLLRANEGTIRNSINDWVGRNPTGTVSPFHFISVAHAGPSGARFYQRGAVGPLSLEAAFILATQVAGINFNTLIQRRSRGSDLWWVGQIGFPRPRQEGNTGSCMTQTIRGMTRRFGFQYRPQSSTRSSGQGRVGFYVIIDVDQDRVDDPNRNVFIFAVHTVDIHSRVQVPNTANLQRLTYTTYVPPVDDASTPNPGTTGAPPAGQGTANTRVYAHAHAAIARFSDVQAFIQQDPADPNYQPVEFPNYSQIGFLHMYILTEDESDIWPRHDYLGQDH